MSHRNKNPIRVPGRQKLNKEFVLNVPFVKHLVIVDMYTLSCRWIDDFDNNIGMSGACTYGHTIGTVSNSNGKHHWLAAW
jgi:hypothetical protein